MENTPMAYEDRWAVKRVTLQPGVTSDQETLDEYLLDGWDPFSVTWDGHVFDVWLKKFLYEEGEDTSWT
jgi:hypothetical protein